MLDGMRMEAHASLVEGKRLLRRDMLLRLQRRRQTLEESKLQLDVPFSPEHGNGHRQRRPQQMTQLQPVPVKSRSGRTIVPVECVNSVPPSPHSHPWQFISLLPHL